MQQRPPVSVHSNCGASRRMSVHDAFRKHEVFTRSGLRMVLRTRNKCLTSGIGGNLWRGPASSTEGKLGERGLGERKMPEGLSGEQARTRASNEFSPFDSNRWSAMFLGTGCLRRFAYVGQDGRH